MNVAFNQSQTQNSKFKTIPNWIVALLLYTLLTLLITYPLIFQLNENMIGPSTAGDNPCHMWFLWWFRQAVESGQDPSHSSYVFGLLPPPTTQVFLYNFFNAVLAWPLQYLISNLATANLLILLGFILSGLNMYLLTGEFVESKLARFLAGFLYSFTTYHFARATAMNLATIQWLPFCAWRVFVFYRQPNLKNALLFGLGLALVPMSDPYYAAYFAVPFGLFFVGGKLLTDRQWFKKPRHLALGGIGLGLALLLSLPLLLASLSLDPDIRANNKMLADVTPEQLSSDVAEFFFADPFNPVLSKLSTPVYIKIGSRAERWTYLGYVMLFLGLSAFRSRQNRKRLPLFWLLLGITGVVLGLGPKVHFLGEVLFDSPIYKLIFGLPFFSLFRAPNRLVVLPLLALAVLAAYTFNSWSVRFGEKSRRTLILGGLAIILMGASLAEHVIWSLPFPTAPLPIPTLYNQMAIDKETALTLDLPTQTTSFYQNQLAILYQYYQTIHQKPLVGGCAPRITDRMTSSISNVPYLAQMDVLLAGRGDTVQGDIFPVKVSFKQGLQQNRIKYVVLHHDLDTDYYNPKLGPAPFDQAAYDHLNQFLLANLGAPFYNNQAEGLSAWRLEASSPPDLNNYSFKAGTGWAIGMNVRENQPERLVEQDGQVFINAPKAEKQSFSFKATAYLKPQTLEVRLNGAVLKRLQFPQIAVTQTIDLGAIDLKAGQNMLELHSVEGCSRPTDFDDKNSDTRCYSFGVQQLQMSQP